MKLNKTISDYKQGRPKPKLLNASGQESYSDHKGCLSFILQGFTKFPLAWKRFIKTKKFLSPLQ